MPMPQNPYWVKNFKSKMQGRGCAPAFFVSNPEIYIIMNTYPYRIESTVCVKYDPFGSARFDGELQISTVGWKALAVEKPVDCVHNYMNIWVISGEAGMLSVENTVQSQTF